jgi:hypothetical protein
MDTDFRGYKKHDPRGSLPAQRAQRCGKPPTVHPCPRILALPRAIFGTVSHAPAAHPWRMRIFGSQSFIDR